MTIRNTINKIINEAMKKDPLTGKWTNSDVLKVGSNSYNHEDWAGIDSGDDRHENPNAWLAMQADKLSSWSREKLIDFLSWNDHNGSYSDEDMAREGEEPWEQQDLVEMAMEVIENSMESPEELRGSTLGRGMSGIRENDEEPGSSDDDVEACEHCGRPLDGSGQCKKCEDEFACPGCGSRPGDGITPGCNDPGGCGYWKSQESEEDDESACPGCGSRPGDGITPDCNDPMGCGYWKNYGNE